MENLISLWQSTGIYNFSLAQVFMMLVGFLLLYLAIKKGFSRYYYYRLVLVQY